MPSSLVTRDAHQQLTRLDLSFDAAHVGLQRVRHRDRAVCLLVVLHHRDQRAADRDAGAVERVDEARDLAVLAAIARVHAPRLEVAADRAGRNLAVHVLARQPDLDVVGLLRGKAHVAGAQRDDAVMQVEPLQHLLGAGEHALVLVRAICSGVVIETSSTLVNWCWRIMPRVSLPAAPASARKHGVQAVRRSGSLASSTMDSRTRLVSGTSAVGMSQRSTSLRSQLRQIRLRRLLRFLAFEFCRTLRSL